MPLSDDNPARAERGENIAFSPLRSTLKTGLSNRIDSSRDDDLHYHRPSFDYLQQ